jgi:5-methylcytosine-specific restriction endonuclease McrA
MGLFPEFEPTGPTHPLRTPCRCGSTKGQIRPRNGQNCLYCAGCGTFTGVNVPLSELGGRTPTGDEIRSRVSSGRRWRILELQSFRCAGCGQSADTGTILHVDHILPVSGWEASGLTPEELNSDDNLWALCSDCNQGKSADPMPPRLFAAILRARRAWRDRRRRG